jgi:GAF domain-containing protein
MGGSVKRRHTITRKPTKTRRGSTTKPKRNSAQTAGRQAGSTPVDLQQQVSALTRELAEAREQQTTTADVLKVISRSTFDLQSVLNTLVESAARLCSATDTAIALREGEELRFVAHHGSIPVAPRIPLERDWVTGRVVLEARSIHVPDLQNSDEFPQGKEMAIRLGGHRATLAVPLLRDGAAIGAILVRRGEPHPFTDKQIALVQNFADQAVIATENARLLSELRESLDQQTATAEILQVISSSSGDLEPVFQAILQRATDICEAKVGNLLLVQDGEFRMVAEWNSPPAYSEIIRRDPIIRPQPGHLLYLLAKSKQDVHIADIEVDPSLAPLLSKFAHARTVLAVAMLREGVLVGVISIYRQEVRPFTDKQIELLRNFGNQAVIAIENGRLLNELRARTGELERSVGELRALGEVSQAVNSTLDLETVLSTIVATAVQLSGTEAGTIYVLDDVRREFHLRATCGMDQDLIDALASRHFGLDDPIVARAIAQRDPTQVADLREDLPSVLNEITLRAGYRARLTAPLFRGEDIMGLLVVRRKTPGAFEQNTVELIKAFATQSALAIQNARLFGEIEDKSRQLAEASQHKSQFLANMSHELRTPLNAIIGLTEMMVTNATRFGTEKAAEPLRRVHRAGTHLLGLINQVLDL